MAINILFVSNVVGMRSADATTLFRTALAILVVYLIIIKFNPFATVFLIAFVIALDGIDGYLAVKEESAGKIGFITYMKASMGDASAKKVVGEVKKRISKSAPHGPRMDVAGDRVVEYSLWIVFTYVHILPIYVILIVLIRHSFVDALMAAKGTSSKMKTGLAQKLYSSNIARGGINVVKFVTFSYLVLMYVSNYPAVIGYILASVLVIYILARGAAEAYESLRGD
jgi:phosphatidylglycerophosphate synthase